MLDLISNLLTLGASLGIILATLARIIPNEKLHAWGVSSGQFLNSFGTSKMGSASWEKLEGFLINSVGQYLNGVKEGLDKDANEKVSTKDDKDEDEHDVRI